jgi:hypothetical protein
MFIHRYLLEHFARMEAPEPDVRPELIAAEGVPAA